MLIGVFGYAVSKSGIQSEVAIPSKMDMSELKHVMKLQDFPSFIEFRIENKSKVNEINIEVRNRTELNVVG